MPELLGYLLLFTGVGAAFIFVNLMAGKFIRPAKMNPEKATIYECGEPAVGSAWVQFDLRFYVVALLFVIFDVEMAFFFPWAVVFGKYVALSDPTLPIERRAEINSELSVALPHVERNQHADDLLKANSPEEIQKQKDKWDKELKELRDQLPALDARIARAPDARTKQNAQDDKQATQARYDRLVERGPEPTAGSVAIQSDMATAGSLKWVAFVDILFFFGVLLVGFAYLWKRGDLDWVRSTAAQKAMDRGSALSARSREQLVVLTKD
jgi:NADH-quinone oxidoreductase subunit A